jgi:hypothetical protein
MKRHHIAAVFALICGGLFTYIRLRDGDTEGAIWTGIIFALLGISDLCPTRNFRSLPYSEFSRFVTKNFDPSSNSWQSHIT